MAEERVVQLKVISPDGIFYKGDVILLELHTTEGQIGIYRNHVPMIYLIEPGIMTITESVDSKKEVMLHSGFVQILQEEITVLVESAEWTTR